MAGADTETRVLGWQTSEQVMREGGRRTPRGWKRLASSAKAGYQPYRGKRVHLLVSGLWRSPRVKRKSSCLPSPHLTSFPNSPSCRPLHRRTTGSYPAPPGSVRDARSQPPPCPRLLNQTVGGWGPATWVSERPPGDSDARSHLRLAWDRDQNECFSALAAQ